MTTEAQPEHLFYPDQARMIVMNYFNETRDTTDQERHILEIEDVYVVWFCKTLQNWKALVSTTVPDLAYYEVTYNGNENEVYLDVYTKTVNRAYSLPPPVIVEAPPKYRTPYD